MLAARQSLRHALQRRPASGHSRSPREVVTIDISTATLIVAILSAAIAFAMLVLKIVEVARRR